MQDKNSQSNKTENDQEASDPTLQLDPIRLRLPQNFGAIIGGQKQLTTILVRKPDAQSFFRVHPEPEYQLITAVLEIKEDRENYLVDPSLWQELSAEIKPKRLCTAITRQGNLFLWPIRMPGEDGKLDTWNTSAHQIAEKAKVRWIRIISNREIGCYDYLEPLADFPDPEWPSYTLQEILHLAFRGQYIQNLTHPVVKRLRGQL